MIFEYCRSSFENFFNKETREKAYSDENKKVIFEQKLFGNLSFIGELYRRKILSQKILDNVFESLLGMEENS